MSCVPTGELWQFCQSVAIAEIAVPEDFVVALINSCV